MIAGLKQHGDRKACLSLRGSKSPGFTLIEWLIAMFVLSLVALGLVQQLSAAHRARTLSADWMRATQLATERMERLRAGDRAPDSEPFGRFVRSWQVEPTETPGLLRLTVIVTWPDRTQRRFTLTALAREEG